MYVDIKTWIDAFFKKLELWLNGIFYVSETYSLLKKERFNSTGSQNQDLSIARRMFYHLSYGGSTRPSSQNLFTPIQLRIWKKLVIYDIKCPGLETQRSQSVSFSQNEYLHYNGHPLLFYSLSIKIYFSFFYIYFHIIIVKNCLGYIQRHL